MSLQLKVKKQDFLDRIESLMFSNEQYRDCFGYDAGEAHPGMNHDFYVYIKNAKEINLGDERVQYVVNFNSKSINNSVKISLE